MTTSPTPAEDEAWQARLDAFVRDWGNGDTYRPYAHPNETLSADIRNALSRLRQSAPQAVDIDAGRIAEVMVEGDGFWVSCSGCYETEDGQNVHGYPHSKVFGCVQGGGCGECGGLGVIWDTTDYADMADFIIRGMASPTPKPEGRETTGDGS